MVRVQILGFLAMFILLLAGQAGAVNYYVDVNSASASDDNDGSRLAPWKSIAKAAEVLAPGDTVKVLPGRYDEQVTIAKSGEKGKVITFVSAERRKAVCRGFIVQGDYVRIEGFEITHDFTARETGNGIHCGEGVYDNARRGCEIVDNYIYDVDQIAIAGGTDAMIRDNLLRNVGRGIVVNSGSLVENNEINGLMVKMIEKDGKTVPRTTKYAFFYGDKITFRGNYFHGTPMKEMARMGVCFFGSWDAWKYGASHDILIENNRCFNGTHASEPIGEVLKQSSRITYRNNLFVNTVYVGVLCKGWSHITVENNTFINCGAYPVWFQTEREVEGSIVRNNLIAYLKHDDREHGGPPAESGIANYKQETARLTCDYNMLWGCKNRGYGEHDFVAEPQFVDPEKGDFRLKEGSPGIDQGVTIEAIKADLQGTPRPQGKAYDLGAYEMPLRGAAAEQEK